MSSPSTSDLSSSPSEPYRINFGTRYKNRTLDEANDPSWIDRAIAKKVKGTHGAPLDDEGFKRELIQRGVLAEENGKVTVKKSPFDVWGDGAEKWTVDA